jgi:multidrug efflux pump subunit AcrA (membrane-fusion protein)
MLLKLLLPDYNRMVTGGSILLWHKAEGEWVAFGDGLFDLKVEAIQVTPLPPLDVPKQIELLINAQAAARHLAAREVAITESRSQPDSQRAVFGMRITSSDHGMLRKIYAQEGDRREIGDLLAVLSTEENEQIHEADHALNGASVFRVVANMI